MYHVNIESNDEEWILPWPKIRADDEPEFSRSPRVQSARVKSQFLGIVCNNQWEFVIKLVNLY